MVKEMIEQVSIGGTILKVVVVALIVMVGSGSFFIVGAGERGVVFSQTQGVKPMSYDEGFHFKTPFIEDATKLPVRTQLYSVKASASSKDLQIVHTEVGVNYHIVPEAVHKLYQEIGQDYQEKVIVPAVQEAVKAVTAEANAEELITKREVVKSELEQALRNRLTNYHLIVETVSITNFDFSPEFNVAIEAKVTAEQNALAEENKVRIEEAKAKQKIAEAQGNAESIRLNAIAEAEKVRVVNEQLAKSANYVQLELIKRWDGRLPTIQGSQGMILQMPFPTQQTA